jgi:hypothetical protein
MAQADEQDLGEVPNTLTEDSAFEPPPEFERKSEAEAELK